MILMMSDIEGNLVLIQREELCIINDIVAFVLWWQ